MCFECRTVPFSLQTTKSATVICVLSVAVTLKTHITPKSFFNLKIQNFH